MDAINFKEVNVRLGEGQEQYNTLPAYWNKSEGSMTFGFKLTEEELAEVNRTGTIWIKQLTFGRPLQPIGGSCLKDELITNK